MSVQFVAEIGSNHEGILSRAHDLILLAARSGAAVVKFQHFHAASLTPVQAQRLAHQTAWKVTPYEMYQQAEVPWSWTPQLVQWCRDAGVEFLSSPYSTAAVEHLDPFVQRWKIGSGEITHRALLEAVGYTKKPVLLGTGASHMGEVLDAATVLRDAGCPHLTLMQCTTNYSGDHQNVDHANLRVLETYREYADAIGLSDHTISLPVALGAVALGATVIERHFTDDRARNGADHPFAMNPAMWLQMVDATRELERALGDSLKIVTPAETESRQAQRRCWRAARPLKSGTVLTKEDVVALRPCPPYGISPMQSPVGVVLTRDLQPGDPL